jgi:hypothetical protein
VLALEAAMFRALVLISLAATPALAGAKLTGIDVKPSPEQSGVVDVVLHANEPLTFQSWARSTPPVLVVDLLDADADPSALAKSLTPGGAIEGIDVTKHGNMSRVSIKLKSSVDYDVTAHGDAVTVSLFLSGKKDFKDNSSSKSATQVALNTARGTASDAPAGVVEGTVGRATGDSSTEVELAQAEGPRKMSYIGFKNTAQSSKIYARLNAEAKFTVRKEGSNLVVLEIQNSKIPLRNNKNHLDTTFFDSPVKMITPSEIDDATPSIRITIEMKEATPFEAKLEGREIVVTFKK